MGVLIREMMRLREAVEMGVMAAYDAPRPKTEEVGTSSLSSGADADAEPEPEDEEEEEKAVEGKGKDRAA